MQKPRGHLLGNLVSSMKWVGVLPFVYRPYMDECLNSMDPKFFKYVLQVDNTKENIGIMKSYNLGVDRMKEVGADWLVVMSAAIRFGKPGGMDFIKVLEDNPDHYVIHAATPNVKGGKQQSDESGGVNGVFGWHLTAFHKSVFDNVGVWDVNFSPYGFDDIDLSVRIQKHYKGKKGWDTFPVDVSDTTMAHSLLFGGVKAEVELQKEYFKAKWGTLPGNENIDEYYDSPFNYPGNLLSDWPKPPNKLAINHGYW